MKTVGTLWQAKVSNFVEFAHYDLCKTLSESAGDETELVQLLQIKTLLEDLAAKLDKYDWGEE